MLNQISSVLKQSLTTFSGKSEYFHQNLELLKALLDKTTTTDLNLNPQFMTESLWKRPNKAPVTYIDIYEDRNITMGVFILKPDMKLPLHNHPQMYGLIKVLFGKLKITCFSINTEKTREFDIKNPLIQHNYRNLITVEHCNDTLLDQNGDCCILEPEKGNLHEIQSLDGPAAFIDILSPPYETLSDGGNGVRKCSYYQIIKELSPNLFRLQEIQSPSWYWTDSYPYTGPELY